jgi:folate-binding protein YgfZ
MAKLQYAESLLIEGPDAIGFAHAQFSSKVDALATGQWQFSAWLDPHGRVRSIFHLARVADDQLLLLLRGGEASVMSAALRQFLFRSKVTITALPARAIATGPAMPLHDLRVHGTTAAFGCGSHSMQISEAPQADAAWRLQQLREGWPWLPGEASGQLLPPALSLHRLGAVAIDKGCYPGQEIVARMHYRGGNKRHLHRVELAVPMDAGAPVLDTGREAGRILDVVLTDNGIEALAVLSDDAVTRLNEGLEGALDGNVLKRLCETWPA